MNETENPAPSARIIVTDRGFVAEDFREAILPLAEAADAATVTAIELDPGTAPEVLAPYLARLRLIRIPFPSFADGRGFTLARRLRLMGYRGRLRASGHVIADQYAMARRAGFDEVEIGPELAARQPEAQWRARADWRERDYQTRLRGGTPPFPPSQTTLERAEPHFPQNE